MSAVTTCGACWVAYFDEGVFGNFGWRNPGPEPIGRFGLVRFDERGRQQTHFPDAYEIADCYAAVVHGESITACYYTDWDIVELSESGELRKWKNPSVDGSFAICRKGNEVALLGGYPDKWDRIVVGRLKNDRFEKNLPVNILCQTVSRLPLAPK